LRLDSKNGNVVNILDEALLAFGGSSELVAKAASLSSAYRYFNSID
jgi:hypothetical protein